MGKDVSKKVFSENEFLNRLFKNLRTPFIKFI